MECLLIGGYMKIICNNCNEFKDYFSKGLCENCFKLQDIKGIDFCGIYKIINLKNNKVYIGQSKNIYKRCEEHKHNLNINKHKNIHLQNAWNKYGEDNFLFEIIEICELDLLDNIEKLYISKYNSMNRDCGYNKESGGNKGKIKSIDSCLKMSIARKSKYSGKNHPLYGKPRSEETKLKLKVANTGKTHSEETKDKISKANSGENHPFYNKKLSEEHRKNISIATKGKIISDETKEKQKIAHKGMKFPVLTKEQEQKRKENRIYKKGEEHFKTILTNNDVKMIKEMLIFYNGSAKVVSEKLNLNTNTIQSIKSLKNWVDIFPEYNEQLKSLKIKQRKEFSKKQLNDIRYQYHQNKITMKELSKIYKCSDETIRRIINYIGCYEDKSEAQI